MSVLRQSEAEWKGDLKSGEGKITLGSHAFSGPYSFKSRSEEHQAQTNPEELIAAAHAGCFSMALSAQLSKAGHAPEQIHTTAIVSLDAIEGGFTISKIELNMSAKVPGIDKDEFLKQAEIAKKNCPVSKALAAVNIQLKATLLA